MRLFCNFVLSVKGTKHQDHITAGNVRSSIFVPLKFTIICKLVGIVLIDYNYRLFIDYNNRFNIDYNHRFIIDHNHRLIDQ